LCVRPRLWLLALLVGAGNAGAANRLYCCNDEQGRQLCSDILPPACIGRAYRELGDSGQTVRRVEAPLSAEQRARRDAEEKQRRDEEAVHNQQRRRDQALLDTYGNERDIDALRSRAEDEVRRAISEAEAKIEEARRRRQKFEDEAEFYLKKTLPIEVEKGLREARLEISASESVIESKKHELSTIRDKYAEDLRRWRELSHKAPPSR
jgi:hypothetical protein